MKKNVKFDKIKGKLDIELVDSIEKLGTDLDVYRKNVVDDIETKSLEEGSRTAIRYVSTRTVDQAGDVVIPKGVDTSLFKKGGMPVFYNHNYSIPQIGRDEWVKKDEWGVKVKQRYADTGEGTLADILWKLTKQDMNKQSSVGIIPLEVIVDGDAEFKTALKALSKEWPEFRKSAKSCRRIITKCVLFEHSDVSLGCNTDTDVLAISKMLTDDGVDEKLLKQLGLENVVEDKDESVIVYKDEDKIVKSDDVSDDETVEAIKIEVEKEVIEEKETSKVTLVREPTVVKLVQKPQFKIDKNIVKEELSTEMRKKLGRLF